MSRGLQGALIVGILLALAANVVLGITVIVHRDRITTLEEGQDETSAEVATIQGDLKQQGEALGILETRPTINLRQLATTLAALQSDVDHVEADVGSLSSRLSEVEHQVERPFGCNPGDVVYWDSAFRGGFTC